ncbi:MAG: hypothetical protein FD166_902 [Bacteroidetes bacterium]|nr:MAG: hypothetical protein FD166_902 [Bacteroidota bacterium]
MKKLLIILHFSFCIFRFAFGQQIESVGNSMNGQSLLSEWIITNWVNEAWQNAWRYAYTYDGNNNLATATEQDWADQQWLNQSLYTYSYDAGNRPAEIICQKWEEILWINDDKETYTYNVNGNVLTKCDYTWSSSLSDWLLIIQKDYIYDDHQNVIEWLIRAYSGGSLIPKFKMTYSYDGSDNMVESFYFTSGDGIVWNNNSRYTGLYDEKNNLIESLSQQWDGSGWVDEFRILYLYDDQNRQTQETNKYWDGSAWVNVNQYKNSYDEYGNKTEHIKQNWGESDWINYERYTFEFSGSSQLVCRTYYLWDGLEWYYFNIGTNTFDEFQNMIQTLYQDWENQTWVNQRLDHFSYIFSNSIAENTESDLLVWPNPTTGHFKVQSSKRNVEFESTELVDVYGKVVEMRNQEPGTCNLEPDISHLPAGIYIIRISLDNQTIVKKIVKL